MTTDRINATLDEGRVGRKRGHLSPIMHVLRAAFYLIHVGHVGSQVFGAVKQSVGPLDLNGFPDFRRTQVCAISALESEKEKTDRQLLSGSLGAAVGIAITPDREGGLRSCDLMDIQGKK